VKRPIVIQSLLIWLINAEGSTDLRRERCFMADVERPLISIVMLCYNHESFVREALEAVLNQTYSPLDLVIIDDCSQDRTADLVAARVSECSNPSEIRFIRNPCNMGLLGTCDIGFRAARGSFIVVTCDDDVMLPEMVAEMAQAWQAHDVSLVTTNVEYIDEHSKSQGRTARDVFAPADDSFETLARDGANACCFGASFGFERAVYLTFGVPPAHLNNLDIMLPFYAYLLKGGVFINKPLLKYRVHGENNSLSLIAQRSDELTRLRTLERIFYGHLAHAIVMQDVLESLAVTMPARYAELAPRIGPLLTIQTVEMAKKLVRNGIELHRASQAQRS
jgi:glycosyltransferase involved in cell wall biosynthesis